MIAALVDIAGYLLPFLIVLTVLVFVHEMGHYLVARWNGVKVEVFSIGFGPEIFGWFDKADTRWKVCWIPLGGYVKFFGDLNAASAADHQAQARMSEAERQVAFHHKRLGQRAAIVAAGPIANFIYAIVVLAVMFTVYGQRVTPAEIGRVLPDSAGEAAGFQAGDVILEVDGDTIRRFEEIEELVFLNPGRSLQFEVQRYDQRLQIEAAPKAIFGEGPDGIDREYGDLGVYPANLAKVGIVNEGSPAEAAGFAPDDLILKVDETEITTFEQLQDIVGNSEGRPLKVEVLRDGQITVLNVAAKPTVLQDRDGNDVTRWLVGIQRAHRPLVTYPAHEAVWEATRTSVVMLVRTLQYVGEIIGGNRGTEDLGGPLRIAQVSGQAAQVGIEQLVMLSVLLSLNLGLINLFPIPVLDGGHLLFYACEAVRGRPLTERMQDFALRIGLAVVLMLMVFATWNDLVNLRVVEFFASLFS